MASKLVIPKSNMLRFVNRTYYATTTPTLDNRLYPDFEYTDKVFIPYLQKFEQSDSVWFQILTDYSNFQLYLVDCSDYSITDISSDVLFKTTDGDLSVYECIFDISGLSGEYYLDLRGYEYQSPYISFVTERFHVKESHPGTVLIQYYGNSTFNDKIQWDKYALFRIDGRMIHIDPDSNKNTYDDSNYELLTLRFDPLMSWQLDIKTIPFWMIEKINLAIGHDEFLIDGIQFNTSKKLGFEHYENTSLYKGNLMLRMVDYENYNNIHDLEGDAPVFETDYRTTGLTDRTTGLTERKINN